MLDYSIESFMNHKSTDAGIPNFRAHQKRIRVKVLKKHSPTTYWIGDKTATCMMRLENEKNSMFFDGEHEQWKNLEENKSYIISGVFKNDEEEKCIFLKSQTRISENDSQVQVTIKSLMSPIMGGDAKKVIHIAVKIPANLYVETLIIRQFLIDLQENVETNNKDHIECEGCKTSFDEKDFFRHVSHNKKCKDVYGGERYQNMRKERIKDINRKSQALSRKKDNEFYIEGTKENFEESGIDWEEALEIGTVIKCEGCDQTFFGGTFYKHVSHARKCKDAYGARFELMKKENRRTIRRISYKKNSEEAKKYHSDNKESRNSRKRQRYNEEKEEELKQKELKRAKEIENEKNQQRKSSDENIKRQLTIWKNCRTSDINKFKSISINENLAPKIKNLSDKIQETVKEFEFKINNLAIRAKDISSMKEINSSYQALREEWRTHLEAVDVLFNDLAKSLATRTKCFSCTYMKLEKGIYPCLSCSKITESNDSVKTKTINKDQSKNTLEIPKNPVPLNEIFVDENHKSRQKIVCKVLKSMSSTELLVADANGSCKIKVGNLKPFHKANLKENNFVRILNAKINVKDKMLLVDSTSSVFKTSKFEVKEGLEHNNEHGKEDKISTPVNVIKKNIKKRKPKELNQEEYDSENDFQIMPHQKKKQKIRNVNRKRNTKKKKVIKSRISINEDSNVAFQAEPVTCESPKKQIGIPKNNSNPKNVTGKEIMNFSATTESKNVKQITVPKK